MRVASPFDLELKQVNSGDIYTAPQAATGNPVTITSCECDDEGEGNNASICRMRFMVPDKRSVKYAGFWATTEQSGSCIGHEHIAAASHPIDCQVLGRYFAQIQPDGW